MDTVTVRAYTSAPREEIYELVSDLAARISFSDHYQKDFRLANPASRGVGAAARYLLRAPLNAHYVETRIVETEQPRRIVEAIHGGHGGRSRGEIVWDLSRAGRGLTEIELTIVWKAGTPRERVMEKLGTRPWLRRQTRKALDRLRVIFEEPQSDPLPRATVAGYEPLKAARFGVSPPPLKR